MSPDADGGVEAQDEPAPEGSHEQGWVAWAMGGVTYIGQIAWETPGYIPQTFLSGEAGDSVVGLGAAPTITSSGRR